MLEQTKRISFRISYFLSKVKPEPDFHTGFGSDQQQYRLGNTALQCISLTVELTKLSKLFQKTVKCANPGDTT